MLRNLFEKHSFVLMFNFIYLLSINFATNVDNKCQLIVNEMILMANNDRWCHKKTRIT